MDKEFVTTSRTFAAFVLTRGYKVNRLANPADKAWYRFVITPYPAEMDVFDFDSPVTMVNLRDFRDALHIISQSLRKAA
jgi:hypothetical protein